MKEGKCYFCGGQATSKEHVPPKIVYKNQDCDSITVPACDSHNQDKSVEDRAIVHGFLLGILNNLSSHSPTQRILAAALKAKQSFNKTKHTTQSCSIIPGGPEYAYITFPPDEWFHQITAGLVYDAHQRFVSTIPWAKAQSLSQNFITGTTSTPTDEKLTHIEEKKKLVQSLESKQWLNGWTPKRPWPSDIYFFQFYTTPRKTWFKHNFYNSYKWYVAFPHTPETSLALIKKGTP